MDQTSRPEVAGELRLPGWEQAGRDVKRGIRLSGPDGEGVFFQHGYARINNLPEEGYLIDFDLYREGSLENDGAIPILDRLHTLGGRAFRWCISSELHRAMEPSALGSDVD